MKGFEFREHGTLDDPPEHAVLPPGQRRESVKRVGSVLLVAVVLACLHREISGTSDGSLLSALTAHVGGALHHLASILFNRSP